MKKIFFNDRLLCLQSNKDPLPNADLVLNLDGGEGIDVIRGVLTAFKENEKTLHLCLRSADLSKTWNSFKSLFEIIVAAGGLVTNPENQLLMIFRNGKWDLPKGKLEKEESPSTAALREVEEECGVGGLAIGEELVKVYHTYFQDGKSILKKTHWFSMKTNYSGQLLPQAEEGITEVKWMSRRELIVAMENTWGSIREMMLEQIINKTGNTFS